MVRLLALLAIWFSGSFFARVFLALGVGFVTYTITDQLVVDFIETAITSVDSLGSVSLPAFQLLRYLGIVQALIFVMSSFSAAVSFLVVHKTIRAVFVGRS